MLNEKQCGYSKTCLKRPLKKKTKICFQDRLLPIMQVKSIAECSKGSILQYSRPSLSYHMSLRSLFFLSIFEWTLKTGFTVLYIYYFILFSKDFKDGYSIIRDQIISLCVTTVTYIRVTRNSNKIPILNSDNTVVYLTQVNEGNSISFIYTIGFYRCFGIHSVISLCLPKLLTPL